MNEYRVYLLIFYDTGYLLLSFSPYCIGFDKKPNAYIRSLNSLNWAFRIFFKNKTKLPLLPKSSPLEPTRDSDACGRVGLNWANQPFSRSVTKISQSTNQSVVVAFKRVHYLITTTSLLSHFIVDRNYHPSPIGNDLTLFIRLLGGKVLPLNEHFFADAWLTSSATNWLWDFARDVRDIKNTWNIVTLSSIWLFVSHYFTLPSQVLYFLDDTWNICRFRLLLDENDRKQNHQ